MIPPQNPDALVSAMLLFAGILLCIGLVYLLLNGIFQFIFIKHSEQGISGYGHTSAKVPGPASDTLHSSSCSRPSSLVSA
ncbi:hypothetical protein [Methanogenium cariaci]|uniref:hypothetical protein n=1 Tax=Methanogenium cariaci TaxID=2197 RepID=UPI00078272AC|nr:hypothetical protein [Methanogenium cariaci]